MCHASRNCDVAVKIASQFLLWRRSAICCLNTGELDTRTGDRKFHFFLSEVLREDFVCLRDFEISSGVKKSHHQRSNCPQGKCSRTNFAK